jgi:uncharacterized protein
LKRSFSKIGEFQKPPRHPKWREVNLASAFCRAGPGSSRRRSGSIRTAPAAPGPRRPISAAQFASHLSARGGSAGAQSPAKTPEQREQLFQSFMKRNRAREGH